MDAPGLNNNATKGGVFFSGESRKACGVCGVPDVKHPVLSFTLIIIIIIICYIAKVRNFFHIYPRARRISNFKKKRQIGSRTESREKWTLLSVTGFGFKTFLVYVRQKRNMKRKFSKPKVTMKLPTSLTVATSVLPLPWKHTFIKKRKLGISCGVFLILRPLYSKSLQLSKSLSCSLRLYRHTSEFYEKNEKKNFR